MFHHVIGSVQQKFDQYLTIYSFSNFQQHFKWVPCHHSMDCPQTADGGDNIQKQKLEMYCISSHKWLTWGGPQAWGIRP
jgi:hypothetical protein